MGSGTNRVVEAEAEAGAVGGDGGWRGGRRRIARGCVQGWWKKLRSCLGTVSTKSQSPDHL